MKDAGRRDGTLDQCLRDNSSEWLSPEIDSSPISLARRRKLLEQDAAVSRRRTRIRIAVACVLVVSVLLVVVDSFTAKRVESAALAFFQWVEANPFLGVISVIAVYIVATILFIPGSILTVGTGFAFGSAFGTFQGVVLASTAVFFGAALGSIASFLLGRYLFRDCVLHMAATYLIFQAVDRALQGNGLKIMILLRLSPLIPFNALDYMSGITSIPLWAYSAALIGILPGTIMFTFIGATASSLAEGMSKADTSGHQDNSNKVVRACSIAFGIMFAVLGVFVASYYSKLELDKILNSEQADQELLTSRSSSPLRQTETTTLSAGSSSSMSHLGRPGGAEDGGSSDAHLSESFV